MTKLTPPNATELEEAFDALAERRLELAAPVNTLVDPTSVPARFLPWLAWSFSVDTWDDQWTEEEKRSVIVASIFVHRRKGTIGAIRRAIIAAGYNAPTIREGKGGVLYNGFYNFDGTQTYGDPTKWAEYSIILGRPISIRQAENIRDILAEVAPVRCKLVNFSYTEAANLYNSAISYDGAFTYGAVA
ncbi:phage tail protein, P2 protein I family [Loktanella atrilutea]|uniref:Phage tail protein, P2 protein I family n=1 Tax=Loktanella atrilutea TaxID=366533 RepID=A0A1M4WE79_LOKAT|nr:phage tail protein I [Loktanella atrilutea]SHE79272.1 phage tail protein, P2 protein I family [Loktanella atrilutea]